MECLATMPAGMLVIPRPADPLSEVRLTVLGLYALDRGAPELRRFIGMVRRCYDYYVEVKPPPGARRLVMSGADLVWPPQQRPTREELRVMGHLLAVEGIGEVEQVDDAGHAFRIGLDHSILAYGKVGNQQDYWELRKAMLDGDVAAV
jgi:hypothetical protein